MIEMSNSNKVLAITTYTPESQMSSPVRLVTTMFHDLYSSRELAWRLTVRDIAAQYRQSYLGLFWAFVPPLMIAVVFIFLQKNKVLNVGDTTMPYPVYALTGTILWQSFVEALNTPLRVLNNAKPMLAKISFPRESLILSSLYQVLFAFLIKVILLLIALPLLGVDFSFSSVLFLFPALMLIITGLTIGTLLTPLGMLYTDVVSALAVLSQALFILTPVIYPPPSSLPYSLIMYVNPTAPFLVGAREALVLGSLENLATLGAMTAIVLLVGFAALILYRLAMPILIERISS